MMLFRILWICYISNDFYSFYLRKCSVRFHQLASTSSSKRPNTLDSNKSGLNLYMKLRWEASTISAQPAKNK